MVSPHSTPARFTMSTQRFILVAAMCVSWCSLAASQDPLDLACVNGFPAKTLCKFVDALPIPAVIDTSDGKLLDIGSYKIKQVGVTGVFACMCQGVHVYTAQYRRVCQIFSFLYFLHSIRDTHCPPFTLHV